MPFVLQYRKLVVESGVLLIVLRDRAFRLAIHGSFVLGNSGEYGLPKRLLNCKVGLRRKFHNQITNLFST